MMRRRATVLAVAACAALWIACGEPPPPVAELTVEPPTVVLGYPGYAALEHRWRFERLPDGAVAPLRVFVHLLDEVDGLVRTFDYPLPEVTVGEELAVTRPIYQSALAPPLTAGSYRLTAGLYDAAGNRWPLAAAGEPVAEYEYPVASVTVREEGEGYPTFYFSPGWMPVVGGTDRQVLARRWRGESGLVTVAEISSPGAVWLTFGIPDGAAEVDELVLDEGVESPSVTVTSSCGGPPVTRRGPGSHELLLPVEAGADGVLPAECEIGFEADFYVISLETLVKRTLALENLAWAAL